LLLENKIDATIKERYLHSFRWTLVGSIVYESIKTIHYALLFYLMDTSLYGIIGSLFAGIYLTAKIADFGNSYTISPFYRSMTASKSSLRQILLKSYFLPQLPILVAATIISSVLYSKNLLQYHQSFYFFIFPTIIVLETARSFLRYFLHTAFKSKNVVRLEVALFAVYVFSIWLPYLCFNIPLSANLILIPHIFDSTIAVAVFSWMILRLYSRLEDQPTSPPQPNLKSRILKARSFNFFLRISRDLFTSHFLTPFFATMFGFKQAGIFFFVGTVVTSIQSIVKAVISYPGGALLASLKNCCAESKREAFQTLSSKLMYVIFPIAAIFIINYKSVICFKNLNSITDTTVVFLLLYSIIMLIEFFFILYEQFFILEEATVQIFAMRVFEFLLLYVALTTNAVASPSVVLSSLIVIKIISIITISITAFYRWKIFPRFRVRSSYAMFWIAVSVICWIALKICSWN
jgi:hypothetical protein